MICEHPIGGEMQVFVDDLARHRAVGASAWPTFGRERAYRCDTGRAALELALRDWKTRMGAAGTVWLPTYVCTSVTRTVARLGLTMRTFGDRPGSKALDPAPLPAPSDLVLIVHYFGHVNRGALAWLDDIGSARSWSLIEDCVQAPYTDGIGGRGDYVIASLRKFWPAPDGAVVCTDRTLENVSLAPADEEFVMQRIAGKLLRGAQVGEALYLDWIARSEQRLEEAPPRQVSWMSCQLLAGVDVQAAIEARRRNWQLLEARLRGSSDFISVFTAIAAGETPLFFPICVPVGRRDRLRRVLAQRRIYCPVHWQPLDCGTPADESLSAQMISLPIDQRYGPQDMAYMLSSLEDFLQE